MLDNLIIHIKQRDKIVDYINHQIEITMTSLRDKQDRKLMKWNNKFSNKINYNKSY